MDIEELKKALKEDGPVKDLINGLIEEATDGLKNKNHELLGKMKSLKEERDTFQGKLDEIDEAKILGDTDDAKKKGDIEKLEKQLKEQFAKKEKAFDEEKVRYNKQINTLVVENGLAGALTKSNIAKQHIETVKNHLKATNKIEISTDGDLPVATVDGKPLDEFVKDWSQGESGKHYVAAANNSGGGAEGSSGTPKGNADISKLSPKEKMNLGRKSN
jgi:hypothetical protein